jgi:HSP20 family protein
MQLSKWNPFSEMDQMFNKFNRNGFLPSTQFSNTSFNEWQPAVDITENKHEYLLKFEVPEIEKENINIEVENGILSVSGERKYENTDEKQHRVERYYGSFSRSFTLPDNVSESDITADQKNGILNLHLKKSKTFKQENKKIEID